MRDLLRLLLLVIVGLPLLVILAGPLLVIAALRGSQAIGPIVLTPGHHHPSGRAIALAVGLVLWAGIWGGCALVFSGDQTPAVDARPPATTPAAAAIPASPSPPPTSVPAGTAQPTVVPLQSVAAATTPTIAPSAAPIQAESSPSVEPAATATQSQVPVPAATAVPVAETETVSPTPPGPVTPEEAAQAVAAVEHANEALRQAVADPTAGNLAALETLWTQDALAKAQAFAIGPSRLVGQPTEVSYAHLMAPEVTRSVTPGHLSVGVTEVWTYSGPRDTYTESFQFFYSLALIDGQWRIVNYSYIDVPQSQPIEESPSRFRPPAETPTS